MTKRRRTPPRERRIPPPEMPPPAVAPPSRHQTDWSIALGLAVATIALYWPVAGHDFIPFDDVEYIRDNPPVRAGLSWESVRWAFTTVHGSFWIPLLWLSLMLDTTLYGPVPGGYHVTNVLLHTTSTVVLFIVLARATKERWPSAFAAALFALHPLHVESVAWVTERKDTLSTAFLMLMLWSYGGYARRPSVGRYLRTLGLYACGLMAKPMLMTAGALLLFVDLWPLRRFTGWPSARLLLEKVPFVVLAVPAALAAMISGGHVDMQAPLAGVPVLPRLANACEAAVLYLVNTVWPTSLAVLYPEYPGATGPPLWRAGPALLVLGGMTVVAVRSATRRPYVTAGWLWYLVALVPVSGVVKIGHFSRADRFTYVPLIGIFVLVAWLASEIATTRRRQIAAGVAGAVLVVAAAVAARIQLGYWRDGVSLFARTVAVTGDNPVARYLYGVALQERQRTGDAVAQFEEALRIWPGYSHAHVSLGTIQLQRGELAGAIAHFEAALRSDPAEAYAHSNLANILMREGRRDEAMTHYAEAIRRAPELVEARVSHGRALAAEGRAVEAIAEYEQALRLAPDDPEAHNNLANALATRGDAAGAVAHYEAALRARPAYAAAHVNFALFLAEHERFPEAIEHFRAALAITPGDAHVQADLGNALASHGQLDDAIVQYREAVRLDPAWAGAHNNLANALAIQGKLDEAVPHYEEAIRLQPADAGAHGNFGQVLAALGRTADAIAHLEEAARLDPGNEAVREHLDRLRR